MLTPLGKRVVIQIKEAEQTTEGGFILTSSSKEKEKFGEVIAIGSAVESSDEIAIGDQVFFKNFAGLEVTLEGQEYLIIDVEDVLAKLSK